MNFLEKVKAWKLSKYKQLNPQTKDPSKSVIMVNRKGHFQAFSTEEMLSKKLNQFEGWLCAAGTESLHINQDGYVQLAACKIGGLFGNIYNDKIQLPSDWVTCDKKACMCGGDMQIRKVINPKWKAYAEDSNQINLKQVKELNHPTWVGPYHYPSSQKQFKTVSWDIGKRCNFACSYCPPEVSNRTDPLQTWDNMIAATEKVISLFGKDKKIKWVITGGEPTIIPDYLKWVDYVYEKGHMIHTTTNGSRGGDYLEKLINKSCIGISVHLEFLNIDRLIESCKRIIEQKRNSEQASWWWFGVRVMVPPNHLTQAQTIKKRLYEIPNFAELAHFFVSPIHTYHPNGKGGADFGELYNYSAEELSGIQELG